MPRIWLKYTTITNFSSKEVCEKGVTTPRGADEQVYKSEAIQRCNEMGAILGPISEREDYDKLFKFANRCEHCRMPKIIIFDMKHFLMTQEYFLMDNFGIGRTTLKFTASCTTLENLAQSTFSIYNNLVTYLLEVYRQEIVILNVTLFV